MMMIMSLNRWLLYPIRAAPRELEDLDERAEALAVFHHLGRRARRSRVKRTKSGAPVFTRPKC